MLRVYFAVLWTAVLLAACGEASPQEPGVPEEVFQRRPFKARHFSGSIGTQAVEASLTLAKDQLKGELEFMESGRKRRIDARMSYEGLVRGNASGAIAENESEAEPGGLAEIKAVMLTPKGLLGTYQNSLSLQPELLFLSDGPDSLLATKAQPQAEHLTWNFWNRIVPCINQDKDTTATISMQVPMPSGPYSASVLQKIQTDLAFDMAYNLECTCQSLEEKETEALVVNFIVRNSDKDEATIELQAFADGLPLFQRSRTFNLDTGASTLHKDPAISIQ